MKSQSRTYRARLLVEVLAVSITIVSCSSGEPGPNTQFESDSQVGIEPQNEINCRSGFGPPTGEVGTSAERPIWSSGWESGSWTDATDRSHVFQMKTPMSVMPGVGGTVRILSPDSARMVIATAEVWGLGEEISLMRTVEIEVPECAGADTYPGLLLTTEPVCVTIEIVPSTAPPYTVEIPVGVQACDNT